MFIFLTFKQEAKGLLGGDKLGDTRQETAKQKKAAKKPAIKRNNTIARTLAEGRFYPRNFQVFVFPLSAFPF